MRTDYAIHHVPGQHLSRCERNAIQKAYNDNLRKPREKRDSKRKLARQPGPAPGTLLRELKRGIGTTPNTFRDHDVWDYSAERAQQSIDEAADEKSTHMRMNTTIEGLLPSKKTKEPVHRAFKNQLNTSIEDRPDISEREEFGHGEMDTVVPGCGGKSGLLVLIERKTRFTIIEKIAMNSRDEVLRALRRILRSGRMKTVLSVTPDNGSEFIAPAKLLRVLKNSTIYYTQAYASWGKVPLKTVTGSSAVFIARKSASFRYPMLHLACNSPRNQRSFLV